VNIELYALLPYVNSDPVLRFIQKVEPCRSQLFNAEFELLLVDDEVQISPSQPII